MLKPKNIAIFVGAAIILVLIYIFVIKKSPEQPALVSTTPSGEVSPTAPSTTIPTSLAGTEDFLSVLLNVRNIKLDVSIFSDPAFSTLHDSSIVLTPDGTEGRPNPFAPIGSDSAGGASGSNQSTQPGIPASLPASASTSTKTKTKIPTSPPPATTTETPTAPTTGT